MKRDITISTMNVVAVHDLDLERALKRLGIYEKISEGAINCMICDEPITMESLGALIKINGKIRVICDKPACLSIAMKIAR